MTDFDLYSGQIEFYLCALLKIESDFSRHSKLLNNILFFKLNIHVVP